RVADRRVLSSKLQQVAMELIDLGMLLAFGEVEFAAPEGFFGFGVLDNQLRFCRGNRFELRQKLAPAALHELGEPGIVIGEIKERTRGGEFLALKEHGCAGAKEQESRHGLQASWRR